MRTYYNSGSAGRDHSSFNVTKYSGDGRYGVGTFEICGYSGVSTSFAFSATQARDLAAQLLAIAGPPDTSKLMIEGEDFTK